MQKGEPVSAPLPELSLVYLLVALVTLAVSYTNSWLTRDFGHLILAATFLYVSLWAAQRSGRSAHHYGIDLSGVLEARVDSEGQPEGLVRTLRGASRRLATELGVALLCAVVVFPPFVALFKLWHGVSGPFTLHLPHDFADFMLGQILVVALPEEALFRGYFQTRLRDVFPRTVRFLGAEISPGALSCQAALFALLHFGVGLSPGRLTVFFPALLFGWLRDRRGGIGAAIWFHAFSNLLSELLARGYL